MSRMGNGGPPAHANSRHNREEKDQSQSKDTSVENGQDDTTEESGSGAERLFSYSEGGLSYTVRVFENEDGSVSAEITVDEGSMDVNAVYFTSEDYDGPSENLGGPLNMNGGGSQFEGESVSWEGAEGVSRPGLGREGEDKPSFLSEGDSLTVDLDAASLDEVDLIGIRATSVNGGDSIKGVSGNPEEPDEDKKDKKPEEPDEDKKDKKSDEPDEDKKDKKSDEDKKPDEPKDSDAKNQGTDADDSKKPSMDALSEEDATFGGLAIPMGDDEDLVPEDNDSEDEEWFF